MYDSEFRIAGEKLVRLANEKARDLATKKRDNTVVWVLVITDDRQDIGGKVFVDVFATEEDAKLAMLINIYEDIALEIISPEDLEYAEDERFAFASDRRYSYEIVPSAIWKTIPKQKRKRNKQKQNG